MALPKDYEDLSDFQLLPSTTVPQPTVFSEFSSHLGGKVLSPVYLLTASFRAHYPNHTVTTVQTRNCNLLIYAAAGYAHAELDPSGNEILQQRWYVPNSERDGGGELLDRIQFGKFKYVWKGLVFIVYMVGDITYILFPPDDDEEVMGHSKATDALMTAVGSLLYKVEKGILVYDGDWSVNHELYEEVQKASWDDVILDENMKRTLTKTVVRFFDSQKNYAELGVPWKRGLIFYGPAGNGKTISLKALMHDLNEHKPSPIKTLYVKSLYGPFDVDSIFTLARQFSPCLLVLEDIDTMITPYVQSYFFNEVDGLENNDGILMIATTNHLDRLDGGLAKRPSRFDRKYNFGLPNEHERLLYARYWQTRLKEKGVKIDFPDAVCGAFAGITEEFSFAYMKEAFVAALLQIARHRGDDDGDENEAGEAIGEEGDEELDFYRRGGGDDDHDDGKLKHNELWIELEREVTILREDMNSETGSEGEKRLDVRSQRDHERWAGGESTREPIKPAEAALEFRLPEFSLFNFQDQIVEEMQGMSLLQRSRRERGRGRQTNNRRFAATTGPWSSDEEKWWSSVGEFAHKPFGLGDVDLI